MAILEVKQIHKDFVSGSRTVKAVNDVSFKVEKGEMIAITGPSGAGKSTILQICAGLMKPSNGKVILDGNDLYDMNKNMLADFRLNHASYIFQYYNLLPMLTARENIALPSMLKDVMPDDSAIHAITDMLGITHRLDHFPSELSGGEQQRVAIARALINDPQCIFADEPTGNLDGNSTGDVMKLFSSLNEKGRTIVIVTHDPEVASYCHRIMTITDGKLTHIRDNV